MGLGGLQQPMHADVLFALLQRAPKLRPAAERFAAGPQVEGAESRLHAVIELVVRNLVVSKKVHVADEEEALLYVNDWFVSEAAVIWGNSFSVQRAWPSGSGIGQA